MGRGAKVWIRTSRLVQVNTATVHPLLKAEHVPLWQRGSLSAEGAPESVGVPGHTLDGQNAALADGVVTVEGRNNMVSVGLERFTANGTLFSLLSRDAAVCPSGDGGQLCSLHSLAVRVIVEQR